MRVAGEVAALKLFGALLMLELLKRQDYRKKLKTHTGK